MYQQSSFVNKNFIEINSGLDKANFLLFGDIGMENTKPTKGLDHTAIK